jgi:toxin FitB
VADVLVDTDLLADHLRGARRFEPRAGSAVSYSVITRAELFAGRASQEQVVATLLGPFRELPVDRPVAELGGRLRREHGVRIADALIAATALVHRLELWTRNVRDFEAVPRLRLRTPSGAG